MRIKINDHIYRVAAIEAGGRVGRRRFWVHPMPPSNPIMVTGEVLGNALRARYDELETQEGNQEELDRLAYAIRWYHL